jgi:hypothetical protein
MPQTIKTKMPSLSKSKKKIPNFYLQWTRGYFSKNEKKIPDFFFFFFKKNFQFKIFKQKKNPLNLLRYISSGKLSLNLEHPKPKKHLKIDLYDILKKKKIMPRGRRPKSPGAKAGESPAPVRASKHRGY